MKATLLLACCVWPTSFGASVIASEPTPILTGEIVLERASYCDLIVVRTELGFFLIEIERAIVALAGGRRVTGHLTASDPQSLDIDGRTKVTARVKAWDSDLRQAKARFDRYCEPEWLDLGSDHTQPRRLLAWGQRSRRGQAPWARALQQIALRPNRNACSISFGQCLVQGEEPILASSHGAAEFFSGR